MRVCSSVGRTRYLLQEFKDDEKERIGMVVGFVVARASRAKRCAGEETLGEVGDSDLVQVPEGASQVAAMTLSDRGNLDFVVYRGRADQPLFNGITTLLRPRPNPDRRIPHTGNSIILNPLASFPTPPPSTTTDFERPQAPCFTNDLKNNSTV